VVTDLTGILYNTEDHSQRISGFQYLHFLCNFLFKRVLELENSLQSSKRQMEKVTKQLKREEQHKQFLEQELLEDQRKIKELELKYNLQVSKVQIL
jgi:hypothetical protein